MKPINDWNYKWERRLGLIVLVLFCCVIYPVVSILSGVAMAIREGAGVVKGDATETWSMMVRIWKQTQPDWADQVRKDLLDED